jgi:acyl carrier protein
VLESLAAFLDDGSAMQSDPIRATDLLRDDLAVDSIKLLMVIAHVADQLDLELSDFADIDFYGINSVADLVEIFESVVRTSSS